jgi:xanthine dehydrogenase accessory factor
MKRETLDALIDARRKGEPCALLRDLKAGGEALIFADRIAGDLAVDAAVKALALKAIADDKSGRLEEPHSTLFVQVFNAPMRLIVVGAVHIAQVLAPMAALAGYGVTVVDPRGAFATDGRFPGVALMQEWPDDGLEALKPDRRTAVVTLTHDPKLDDAALSVALKRDCFYVGSLGSKKTHQARLNRLGRLGFGEAELKRIHGPIGLAIGALTPAEIALAIMAEITQVRRQKANGA